MTLQHFIQIGCDNCGHAIEFYSGKNKEMANKLCRKVGGIVKGGLHFCDENCQKKYKK